MIKVCVNIFPFKCGGVTCPSLKLGGGTPANLDLGSTSIQLIILRNIIDRKSFPPKALITDDSFPQTFPNSSFHLAVDNTLKK